MSANFTSTILLTGGSSGIGLCAVKELAAAAPNSLTVVASRTAPPAPQPRNVEFKALDLSSPESVRSFVASWAGHPPISALVCNAGIFPFGAPKYSPEGIELGLATNHAGHALLIFLLAAGSFLAEECRIVLITSALHDPKAPGAPAKPYWPSVVEAAKAEDPKMKSALVRYANSKFANILFAYALERRVAPAGHPGWQVIAFEPGYVPGGGSKLGRDAPAAFQFLGNLIGPLLNPVYRMLGTVVSTPPRSGKELARVVLADEYKNAGGKYVLLDTIKPSSAASYDETLQDDLWRWTINAVAQNEHEKAAFEAL